MGPENHIIDTSESETQQLPSDPQALKELLIQWAKQLLEREQSPPPQIQNEQ